MAATTAATIGGSDGSICPGAPPTVKSICLSGIWQIPPGNVPLSPNPEQPALVISGVAQVIGNLTVGPNSTLSFVVDGNGASILMVSGCLSLNGSRLELQLQQEPQAGQYDVASTACLVGRPAQVVGVRIFFF